MCLQKKKKKESECSGDFSQWPDVPQRSTREACIIATLNVTTHYLHSQQRYFTKQRLLIDVFV